MAQKKSFKDNPALRFISTPDPDDLPPDHSTAPAVVPASSPPRNAGRTTERKSKRLNLLTQPSTCDALTKIAYVKQSSLNELINTVLKAYVRDEADAIEQYNRIFPREEH